METMQKYRKINSFILSFCIFYLLQNVTIGELQFFENNYIFQPILLKEIIFVITSITLNLIIFDWKKIPDNSDLDKLS